MSPVVNRLALRAGAMLASVVLVVHGPLAGVALQVTHLAAGRATVDEVAGVAAAVATGALVGWFGLTLLLTGLAELPGTAGATAGRVAIAVAPPLLRRGAALILGLSVVGVAAPAQAASAHPAVTAAALGVTTDVGVTHPRQASTARESAAPPRRDAVIVRSLDRPASPAVVVVAGDCLWDIAARGLGPAASDADIAAEWPRWHDRNRAVIGADPDLIQPGQRLVEPA